MNSTDQVIIVGAGPTGAVSALRLLQAGIRVTMFDCLAIPSEDHRAATHQPSTLDMFKDIGLIDEVLRQGLKAPIFQWRDGITQEIVAEFDYGRLSNESAYPFVIQLEQHKTINIALNAAQEFDDFNLIRPADVLSVQQNSDFVEATVQREDGSIEVHGGRYLIGCDGGRSLVRKTMGVSFDGFTWPERFLVFALRYDFAEHGFQFRTYCAHPARSSGAMKVPGTDEAGVWRSVFPVREHESEEEVLTDEWIVARIKESLPARHYDLVHKNLYAIHQRVAGSFRVGRLLLAGDAAHINNPTGGMGMNSGMQDGLNLAAKLEQIWRGADADQLLDRYDRQRRFTAIEFVQAQSIANKKMLMESDLGERRKGFDNMRRIAADPEQHLDFVRRASLIAMHRKSEAIT